MRKLLTLAIALIGATAFCGGTQITASGGSPIPTAFSASNTQSQVQECQGNVIEVQNESATKLVIGFGTSAAVPPFDYKFVPSGPLAWQSFRPKGGFGSGTYIYIRSAGSAVTSGTVSVSCTSEDQI